MKILTKITNHFHQNKPFVVYRKPNKNLISGFFMDDDTLKYSDGFSEEGFVFAPFNDKNKAILFQLEQSDFISEELSFSDCKVINKEIFCDDDSKNNHIKLVEKTIDKIISSEIKKIVVSRKEIVDVDSFNLLEVYQKLLKTYKNAFVYVWFHPKVGLWLGATPETLLEINKNSFKTMSLAGTQVSINDKKIVWKSKEHEEQQLVTDFIENQLESISSNLKIDKKETIRAGSLLHLRTKVAGDLNINSSLKDLIKALHPTPAVCGLPREEAKLFILENEGYDRKFYTGFLGEINLKQFKEVDKKSSLFVNLRCMQIEENKAYIYVGGGITKNSSANNEWKETVSKSKVMKCVL